MRKPRLNIMVSYLILIFMGIFTLFPFLWTFMTSIKTEGQLFSIPPQLWPNPVTFGNYAAVLKDGSMMQFMYNTLFVTLVTTMLALLLAIPAAYGFSKFHYRFSGLLFAFVVSVRMVPPIILSIPYFLMISELGLLNTKTALIIAYLPLELTMMIWLMEGFFRQFPKELEEAADLDGLDTIGKLARIVVPISLPSISISTLFGFLISWNEFMLASTLTRTSVSQTMPIFIASSVTTFQIFWGKLTANGVLYMLPVILFTLFAQKGIVKGLTAGAIKE